MMVYLGWCEKHNRKLSMGHQGEGVCSLCNQEERDQALWERDKELREKRPLFYHRNMKKSSWPHLWVNEVQ